MLADVTRCNLHVFEHRKHVKMKIGDITKDKMTVLYTVPAQKMNKDIRDVWGRVLKERTQQHCHGIICLFPVFEKKTLRGTCVPSVLLPPTTPAFFFTGVSNTYFNCFLLQLHAPSAYNPY